MNRGVPNRYAASVAAAGAPYTYTNSGSRGIGNRYAVSVAGSSAPYTSANSGPAVGNRYVKSIGRLQRGSLAKHGYEQVRSMTVTGRHDALKSAATEYGWPEVRKKLLVLYTYNKYRNPELARLFWEDALYSKTLSDVM